MRSGARRRRPGRARECRAPRRAESARDTGQSARAAWRRGLAGGERRCAAARPGHARHGDDDAEHARELRHAVGAEPEAVEPERLDREATDRVEADVAEEERARAAGESRAEPGGEEP